MTQANKDILTSNDIPMASSSRGVSAKQMISYQISSEMARQRMSRAEMAARMGTSRAQLNRLLDPDNQSVTLQTVERAAALLGLTLVIKIEKAN